MKTGHCAICAGPIEEDAYGGWRSSLSGSEFCPGGKANERHTPLLSDHDDPPPLDDTEALRAWLDS